MLSIVSAPHVILSHVAKRVERIDASTLSFIEEMKKALAATKDPEGVGLAAPQVGKSIQIFITKPTSKSAVEVFINPILSLHSHDQNDEVTETDQEKTPKQHESTKLEGCLSLPHIWGEVQRAPIVTLEYINEYQKPHTKTFRGFTATVIQHEYDHLHGILFPKRVLEQNGTLYKSHKNKKGEDEFEEIEL